MASKNLLRRCPPNSRGKEGGLTKTTFPRKVMWKGANLAPAQSVEKRQPRFHVAEKEHSHHEAAQRGGRVWGINANGLNYAIQ